MATVVVALGGSLLRPEVEERHKWLKEMVGVVTASVSSGVKLALVVGGGAPAREGIELARPVIEDLRHLDRIGIAATRLNATIVREAISEGGIEVSGTIPKTIEDAVRELSDFPVVVMGGTVPGHTTDAVAIRLAIQCEAEKCVIATNVSKVHSDDPRENPNAVSFDRLTLDELQEIVGPPEHADAGASKVVDPVGVGEAREHGLPLDVLDGRDPGRIFLSLNGEEFEGTKVRS
tara:strand:+ start:615 stop:1316 length:702 start_codon:yes stop_codon:yes gene_type:complete